MDRICGMFEGDSAFVMLLSQIFTFYFQSSFISNITHKHLL